MTTNVKTKIKFLAFVGQHSNDSFHSIDGTEYYEPSGPQANGRDAICLDLHQASCKTLHKFGDGVVKLDTGIVLHPDSYHQIGMMKLYIRSSMSASLDLVMANGVGVIEPSYAGFINSADGKLFGITGLIVDSYSGGGDSSTNCTAQGDRILQLELYDCDGYWLPAHSLQVETQYCTKAEWLANYGPDSANQGRGGLGSTGSK